VQLSAFCASRAVCLSLLLAAANPFLSIIPGAFPLCCPPLAVLPEPLLERGFYCPFMARFGPCRYVSQPPFRVFAGSLISLPPRSPLLPQLRCGRFPPPPFPIQISASVPLHLTPICPQSPVCFALFCFDWQLRTLFMVLVRDKTLLPLPPALEGPVRTTLPPPSEAFSFSTAETPFDPFPFPFSPLPRLLVVVFSR